MSYDLMVFRKDLAPTEQAEFMQWYDAQTQWAEEHSYDDPENTTKELQGFFFDMIKIFPAMNGPFAHEEADSDYITDYCIGKDVIYIAFAWSLADEAYDKMFELAEKWQVGFFDVSGDNNGIFFPDGKALAKFSKPQKVKPRWKIW